MNEKEKYPYPKAVFFIVSNEFCERFCYYGMRTILALYLTNILLYSEADAKVIYHSFTMFAYFFPLLGAILSDSFLGKFRTIFYVSIIYAAGSVLLALASAKPIGLPQNGFSILALILIAVGTGGIKPCVAAFGGDQFKLPQQEAQLALYFSLFYFSINAGSLISTFLTPILRNEVHCFNEDSCFPLAFAVPGVLMIVALALFLFGKPMYIIKKPEGNIIVKVCKCVWYAITERRKAVKKEPHWMDHATKKYGSQLVNDIKSTFHVLVLYIPLPIFWTLFDQQGSGWTFQARRMDGDVGIYTLLPDQMQVVNPLLILAFIPIFSYGVYPVLNKCRLLTTPLQKMCCGGFLAALAFAVSAIISIQLENTYPVLPSNGNIQLRVYNPSNCSVNVEILKLNVEIGPMGYYENKDIQFEGNSTVPLTLTSSCLSGRSKDVQLKEATAFGVFIGKKDVYWYEDDVSKSEDGYPKIRTLAFDEELETEYTKESSSLKVEKHDYSLLSLKEPGKYKINNGPEVAFKLGGTYSVMISETNETNVIEVTQANSVHMLWLLPQYIIITAAEIMFSITGLEFSYSQAPVTMKSLLQACWLLTTAIGNAIIVVIESAIIFEKQSNDFFLYTGLMVVDMLVFSYMAYRYKYITTHNSESELEGVSFKTGNGIENAAYKSTE